MSDGAVAGRITAAPLMLPRWVAFATFTRAAPDETTGGAARPPSPIAGDTPPGLCSAGTGGCAPTKFRGETTGCPIALRAVGAVLAPAWPRDEFVGITIFTLGLLVRICCCPCGSSTGGATAVSASIGTVALLGAGFAPLTPFPRPPLLAALARIQRRVRPRSEEHTSELQSHLNLVCRLLLEKKKTQTPRHST